MNIQYFNDNCENDKEVVDLAEEINNRYQGLTGTIFYKFPTIKEFDKVAVQPDLLLVSQKHGVVIVVADTMNSLREDDYRKFCEKKDSIDNIVYTNLLKDKQLKADNRSLLFTVNTIGFCPNLVDRSDDTIFNTINSITNYLDKLDDNNLKVETVKEIISSLESSAAIIKPKERILPDNSITKAKLLKEIESQIARFDDEQRVSALSLLDGPQRIRGLAGSGKTIILCLKAANLHLLYPDKTILYTFYTRSLYDYIIQLINRFYIKMTDGQLPDYSKIHVLHAWGGRAIPGVYYEACKYNGITPLTFDDTKGIKDRFAYVCSEFIEQTKNTPSKTYDYILMDEAQDFPASFYQLCRSIVKNDHLIWCYDEVQNIFDVEIQNTKKTFSNKYDEHGIDLVSMRYKHPRINNDIVLHKSYRNVKEVLLVAVALGFGIYNDRLVQSLENNSHWEDLGFRVVSGDCSKEEQVIIERNNEASPLKVDESLYGKCISIHPSENLSEEVDWISNEISEAINVDHLLPEDIAVICLDDYNSSSYIKRLEQRLGDNGIDTFNVMDKNYIKGFYREGKVTLSSVYKAKGNEASMVFVCGCDFFEKHKNERKVRNTIFTAFTRAKVWLRISGTGQLNQLIKEINSLIENDYKLCFYNKPTHLLDKDWNEDNNRIADDKIIAEITEASKRLGISPEAYLKKLFNQGGDLDE